MKGRRVAVALGYEKGDLAPVVLASGKGELAERMLAIAEENGIRVVEDSALAQVLVEADIGSCIPEDTWRAVAAVFAFLERASQFDK